MKQCEIFGSLYVYKNPIFVQTAGCECSSDFRWFQPDGDSLAWWVRTRMRHRWSLISQTVTQTLRPHPHVCLQNEAFSVSYGLTYMCTVFHWAFRNVFEKLQCSSFIPETDFQTWPTQQMSCCDLTKHNFDHKSRIHKIIQILTGWND